MLSETFDTGAVYPLSRFTRAPALQAPGGFQPAFGSTSPTEPKVSGNVPRLASVRDLPDSVPEKVKVLILQGKDPEETGPIDRSRIVFGVVCALIRSGVTDDIIFSVLTDESFGISAHVRAQSSPRAYALRQIRRGKENAIDPHLVELNERHAVVENFGGHCKVIEELPDPKFGNRPKLTFQAFEDFKHRYMHRNVTCGNDAKGNPIEIPLGNWWLKQAARRQYRSIAFAPGKELEGVYNLWRGFAVEARPGDKHHKFLAHVRDNLCDGDAAVYEYLLSWMARAVQFPDSPGEVAIVLRGKKGAGKGTFARWFGSLFGRHYWAVSNAQHIVGNFNAHLRDCVVLFGDEAFWAGDKKHESVLKALITEETFVVEKKGVDAESAPNYVHLVMASNEQWVVPASHEERRYLVLDVAATYLQDTTYFGALDADFASGGPSNLLYELQTRDLSSFNHRVVPATEALADQKLYSMAPHEEWWYRKLCDGSLRPLHVAWTAPISKHILTEDYLMYAQRLSASKRITATTLARALNRWAPGLVTFAGTYRGRDDNGDPVVGRDILWEFPDLEACRTEFAKQWGGKLPWPEVQARGMTAGTDPF